MMINKNPKIENIVAILSTVLLLLVLLIQNKYINLLAFIVVVIVMSYVVIFNKYKERKKNNIKELNNAEQHEDNNQEQELISKIEELKTEFYQNNEIKCSEEDALEILEIILNTKFDRKSINFFYHLTKKSRETFYK
uniref:Uncharacterized protein n=1 Tax=Francisella tularensis subsp. novicida PA10-7858 TaxID=1386968 RepID=V5T984_FRANO|nr:hypothetical protein [Francisella tularensis]AHB60777.1 hypothetical protein N894_0009 [Francisella tularensis subsp. novicida PA10-7858]